MLYIQDLIVFPKVCLEEILKKDHPKFRIVRTSLIILVIKLKIKTNRFDKVITS